MPSQFGTCTDLTKCRDLRDHTSDTGNSFLFIKSAANIFLMCDNFYKVLLVFYSLPISVTSFPLAFSIFFYPQNYITAKIRRCENIRRALRGYIIAGFP